jgi:hypothetical protein
VLNPTGVVVAAQGSGCTTTAPFGASETGYTGKFNAVSNNTAIATVSPAQSSNSFTVTSVTTSNSGGLSTTITVTDSHGQSQTENVSISICLP